MLSKGGTTSWPSCLVDWAMEACCAAMLLSASMRVCCASTGRILEAHCSLQAYSSHTSCICVLCRRSAKMRR